FFSSRRRHTRLQGDWSSDVCYSDLNTAKRLSPPESDPWCAGRRSRVALGRGEALRSIRTGRSFSRSLAEHMHRHDSEHARGQDAADDLDRIAFDLAANGANCSGASEIRRQWVAWSWS